MTRSNNKLLYLTCIGLLSGLALSPVLWFAGLERGYPRLPIFEIHPMFSKYDWLLSLVLAGSVLALFTERFRIVAGTLALTAATALVLTDISRLQPWFYQYLWFILVIVWSTCKKNELTMRAAMQYMLACMYIWAGLAKCSASYFLFVFPAVFATILEWLIDYPILTFIFAALGPVLEVWIGISFLFLKNSRLAVLTVCALHALILLAISPTGINFNSVVWPWNICMPLFAILLYWDSSTKERPLAYLMRHEKTLAILLTVFFIFMPVLNKAGYWDNYLSFSLYSGRVPEGTFSTAATHRDTAARYFSDAGTVVDSTYQVHVYDWSYAVLNIPAYPEVRTYKALFTSVCKSYPHRLEFTLLQPARAWYAEQRSETWSCNQETLHAQTVSVRHGW